MGARIGAEPQGAPGVCVGDLFDHQREQQLRRLAPLADRLRPRSLEEFAGQEAILGPGRLLRRAIRADRVGNLILHGPPGTGKTTLARIIAGHTHAHFSSLNAVLAGVKELRQEVDAARERLARHGLRTILFIDEVHRFNAAQQDALLPWVENGTVSLIGATTENPFFEVNKALVSRARLFRLQPLQPADLHQLLRRALTDAERGYGDRRVRIEAAAADHLVAVAGGDARSLLNALELAVETTDADSNGVITIDLTIAEESIQQRAVLYDKQGDAHFDTISAFIKSLRGSDPDAALFWLARMVEAGENPRFIFRRMLIAAGEDVGLADPQAIVVVQACAAAFDRVGLPEGLYSLAQAALYLAGCEKSNSSLGLFDAIKAVRSANRQAVPSHLRDANRDGKAWGDGVGYRYPHAVAEHWLAQQYLPSSLQGEVFWQPGPLGWEGQLRPRLQLRRAAQLAASAETALDQPERLSSAAADPLLDRWLRRQAAAAGERLERLRQRFWQNAPLGRLDRVLVLEAHSLLWALDPLQACAEGEVVVTVPSQAEQLRLEAQLQLLDQLRRPRLLLVAPAQPQRLASLLAEQPDGAQRFEWIVARQPLRDGDPELRQRWLEQLGGLAAPGARLRWLWSDPGLGPAGGLLEMAGAQLEAPERSLLERARQLEQPWLQQQRQGGADLERQFKAWGWELDVSRWRERLELPLSEALLQRWFAPTAPYRTQLRQELAATELDQLAAAFQRQRGGRLVQLLEHRLLDGWLGARSRPSPPATPGRRPPESPDRGRGA